MRILKQPSGMDFKQPLLNKLLRVHVSLMHTATQRNSYTERTFHDAESREVLPSTNWRVKVIKRIGS